MNDVNPRFLTVVDVVSPGWQIYGSVFGSLNHWVMQLVPAEVAYYNLTYIASTS